MINYRFSRKVNRDFSKIIRKRVNTYFKENDISRNGNTNMGVKSVFALSFYIAPFVVMLTSGIHDLVFLFSMWILMGVGTSFIGMLVMHDSLHGSYSQKSWVNKLMGFSTFIIGMSPLIWHLQHNVLHHSFTNIEEADEDIDPRFVLRFSEHQPLRWFHKYQHIYAMLFYSLSTVFWVYVKDFVKLFQYREKGLVKRGAEFRKVFATIIVKKVLYLALIIGLPVYILPVSVGTIILMYLAMHVTTGTILSLIFQPAHVTPEAEFYDLPENEVDENWYVHQLRTTSNYAINASVFSWFIGGLNFQVEHHLFPNVCHIHYPAISKIVRETTKEMDLPYYNQPSFASAVKSHFLHLKKMGKG